MTDVMWVGEQAKGRLCVICRNGYRRWAVGGTSSGIQAGAHAWRAVGGTSSGIQAGAHAWRAVGGMSSGIQAGAHAWRAVVGTSSGIQTGAHAWWAVRGTSSGIQAGAHACSHDGQKHIKNDERTAVRACVTLSCLCSLATDALTEQQQQKLQVCENN